jgi:ArsR family transcriptional regulator, lead/cadmium/zinc/bismuth-responsive transcriptional repressor
MEQLQELAEVFRLLGDPSRLRVLIECRRGPIPVGAIAESTGLSPSLVSHHLRLLRATRIVRADRQGRHVLYSLDDHNIDRVLTDMLDHLGESAPISDGAP